MKRRLFVPLVALAFGASAQYYTNPVISSNFPDPTFIKADDGNFYAYCTQGPLGDIPIYRSSNLVDWEYISNAFPDKEKRPSLLPGGNLWAPDITKVGDKYVLTYSQSKWGEEHLNGLGIATASTPTGPFIDQGKLFTSDEIGVQNSIDPSLFITDDNRLLLLWGSFSGLYMIELDPETLKVKDGASKKQVAGRAFEGSHIFKHNGKYYLFASIGSCCEGDNSTYHVGVGRSDSPTGPFIDHNGKDMIDNGYTLVISGDNITRGPGHGSQIATDTNGDTWYLYHGYTKGRAKEGRMMWLDKILWDEQGWPYIETGSPSHTPQKAPVFK
jgi:Beta-xylosidase